MARMMARTIYKCGHFCTESLSMGKISVISRSIAIELELALTAQFHISPGRIQFDALEQTVFGKYRDPVACTRFAIRFIAVTVIGYAGLHHGVLVQSLQTCGEFLVAQQLLANDFGLRLDVIGAHQFHRFVSLHIVRTIVVHLIRLHLPRIDERRSQLQVRENFNSVCTNKNSIEITLCNFPSFDIRSLPIV